MLAPEVAHPVLRWLGSEIEYWPFECFKHVKEVAAQLVDGLSRGCDGFRGVPELSIGVRVKLPDLPQFASVGVPCET